MPAAGVAGQENNWEELERQDWHLWVLAVLLLFVLGISLLSFMFPSVFWMGRKTEMDTPERAFFGFCILLALTLVYMLQRQAAVRRLKRSLYRAQAAASEAEQQLHLVSLTSLPELNQFRDSLAMEYRRASHANENLSVLLLRLESLKEDGLGRAAQTLRQMLRPHETLFRISSQRFGLILPAMRPADVEAFSGQISERLRRAFPGEQVSCSVLSYPEHAGSLSEMEACLRLLTSADESPAGSTDSTLAAR